MALLSAYHKKPLLVMVVYDDVDGCIACRCKFDGDGVVGVKVVNMSDSDDIMELIVR